MNQAVQSTTTAQSVPASSSPVAPATPNLTDTGNGGIFVGKSHDNNGIKFVVQPTGQKIEVEGGEFLVCEEAMNSSNVYTFKGTPLEIAKKINELFNCSTEAVTAVAGGQYVMCNAATQSNETIEVSGTVKEILNKIAHSVKCNGVETKGAPAAPAQPAAMPVMGSGGIVPSNSIFSAGVFFFNPLFM